MISLAPALRNGPLTQCYHALTANLRWRISTFGLAGVFSAGASRRLRAAMPVAAMCSTTWSKKSGFSGESGPQFGLTVGGRGGSPGWRLQFPSSWLIKKASLRLPSSDGGASNLRRPTLLSKRKRQAKLSKLKDITSVAYMTAQEQLDTNSVRFTWSSWSMPLANVPSAGGSQAA